MRNFLVEIIYIVEGDGTHLQTLELKIHYFNFYYSSQTLTPRKVPAYDLFHVLQILGERVTTSEPQSPDAPDVTHNNLILLQRGMINSLVSELQGVAVIARGEDVSGLRGGSTPNSDGNFVNSNKSISSMLFVLQQSVVARSLKLLSPGRTPQKWSLNCGRSCAVQRPHMMSPHWFCAVIKSQLPRNLVIAS